MQNGWRIGTLLGIPLFIHYSWFPIAALITLSFSTSFAAVAPHPNPVFSLVGGLLVASGIFGSVLAHELAHSLVALRQGIRVSSITLFVLGGMAAIEREAPSPKGAFWVAVAGPALSIGLFVILQMATSWTAGQPSLTLGLSTLASINLALGVFNLLPGLPLDGGQILKAVVWGWTGDRNRGILWAARSGQVLGIGMIGLGISALLLGRAWAGLWVGLLGLFILSRARDHVQYGQLQRTLASLVAEEVMTRQFRVVDLMISLREFVDRYLTDRLLESGESRSEPPSGRAEVYFAESDGRYKGWIRPERLRTIERSQWDQLDLSAILQPFDQLPPVRQETPVNQIIEWMQQQDLKRVVVFSPTGAVAGVIDKGDIVAGLAQKMGFVAPPELLHQIREQNELPGPLAISASEHSKDT